MVSNGPISSTWRLWSPALQRRCQLLVFPGVPYSWPDVALSTASCLAPNPRTHSAANLVQTPKPPPMLSSVPEDTFGGLQAATSPLPDSLALKQNPCFAPLPRALAECFPDPADYGPA